MWRATQMPRERLRVSGRRGCFPVVILTALFATSGGDPAPEDAARTVLRFAIEDMPAKDAEGHFGYWRVAACLVGWERSLDLWRNR